MDTRDTTYLSRSARYELSEDVGRNPSTARTLGDVINARFGRREMMRGALAVTAIGALATPAALLTSPAAKAASASFRHRALEAGVDETTHVAAGHRAPILNRRGKPAVQGE